MKRGKRQSAVRAGHIDHERTRCGCANREPVEGNEILLVILRRLLGKMPEAAQTAKVKGVTQKTVDHRHDHGFR